jgi:hypothetical protein
VLERLSLGQKFIRGLRRETPLLFLAVHEFGKYGDIKGAVTTEGFKGVQRQTQPPSSPSKGILGKPGSNSLMSRPRHK